MSRLGWFTCLVLFVSGATVGCQNAGEYFEDRGKDFVDMASVEVYWGQGVLANARLTKVAQLGAGAFDGDVFRYNHRAYGILEEIRAEAGVPLYYYTAYDREVLRGNEEFIARHEDPEHVAQLGEAHYNLTDDDDRGFYEVGGSVAAFFGLGVSLDLLQILDFTTGWFFLDLGRDDIRNMDRQDVRNPRYMGIGETPVSGG